MPGMFDPYFYGRMRANMPPTDPMHKIVAPLEHREFVEDAVRYGHPLMAPAMAGAIPMWTWLKYLGIIPKGPNTSPASLDEIFAGYEGLFSGLQKRKQPPQERPNYANTAGS